MSPCNHSARALTLVELLVVLAVLVALAGIVIPLLDGSIENGAATSTRASLTVIRDAIMGTDKLPGYLQDVGELPQDIKDLFVNPFSPQSDPQKSLKWHGPYLNGGPTALDGWAHPIVLQAFNSSDPKESALFTRIISAGPDGVLTTSPTTKYPLPTTPSFSADRGDDILLFLKRSDVSP